MAALIMRATQLKTITEVQRGHLWTKWAEGVID